MREAYPAGARSDGEWFQSTLRMKTMAVWSCSGPVGLERSFIWTVVNPGRTERSTPRPAT